MALDSSLFTLTLQRRLDNAAVLDLIPFTPSAISSTSTLQPEPLYSFSRARSADYNVQLIDRLTSIPLSSIISPSSADKIRKIDLYNPDETIIFEKRDKVLLRRLDWRWTWQNQEYLIRRDGGTYIVEADRHPDPEIDIARYTPATKTRPAFLQILDYNVSRLEVADRRGLEVLILTAVCTMLDLSYDEKHKDGAFGNIYMSGSPSIPSMADSRTPSNTTPSSSQAANEIIIDLHSPNEIYVQHAIRLMRQDEGGEGLHLIILKATNAQSTPKAVQVAAEIKLKWYRLQPMAKGRTLDPLPGSTSETAEELYQYVRDPSLQKKASTAPPTKEDPTQSGQRRRIKLDSPSPSPSPVAHPSPNKDHRAFLSPPEQLDIYLSKERIDEFEMTSPASSSLNIRHATSSPARLAASTAPIIPPKNNRHNNHTSSDNTSSHAIKSVLGKLGLRKTVNEG